MQVSKWLGHSSYVLTLTTYGDYIPDEEATNPLPEPVAPAAPATNVVCTAPASSRVTPSIAPRHAAQCLPYRHLAATAQPGGSLCDG